MDGLTNKELQYDTDSFTRLRRLILHTMAFYDFYLKLTEILNTKPNLRFNWKG